MWTKMKVLGLTEKTVLPKIGTGSKNEQKNPEEFRQKSRKQL